MLGSFPDEWKPSMLLKPEGSFGNGFCPVALVLGLLFILLNPGFHSRQHSLCIVYSLSYIFFFLKGIASEVCFSCGKVK